VALSTEFSPLSVITPEQTGAFQGGVSTFMLGKVKLAVTHANSGLICHWSHKPKVSTPDFYRLQIQQQGETRYHFRRGEAHCPPNSILLIEGDSEVSAEQPAEARGVHVLLPRILLEAQIRTNGLDCFKPVSADEGSARILCEITQELLKQGPKVRPVDEAAFVSSLVWMVGAVFASDKSTAPAASALGIQFERVVRSIERNYSDPDYNIRRASSELGISLRYIQAALRHFGTSFSSMLLRRRLAASQDLLAHLSVRCNPVTEAAFNSGFSDLSHFSRSFSQEYGMSPKAYRELVSSRKAGGNLRPD